MATKIEGGTVMTRGAAGIGILIGFSVPVPVGDERGPGPCIGTSTESYEVDLSGTPPAVTLRLVQRGGLKGPLYF